MRTRRSRKSHGKRVARRRPAHALPAVHAPAAPMGQVALSARAVTVLMLLQHSVLVPRIMWNLCHAIVSKIGLQREVNAVEFFAGQKAVTLAFQARGWAAVPFELLDDPAVYDFMSDKGFLLAITFVLSLKHGGFLLGAPVCSTWVWMSRFSTGRSEASPMAWESKCSAVWGANQMVSRFVLLLRLAEALGALWVFEQPVNSLMQRHDRFQELFSALNVRRTSWYLGDFGAQSKKPTWLYSNKSLAPLAAWRSGEPRTNSWRQLVATSTVNGKRAVTGLKCELKESQAYPHEFGVAMCKLYEHYHMEMHAAISDCIAALPRGDATVLSPAENVHGADLWHDAGLQGCFDALR
jgi:hypothetical protein